jgi:hypothetical protein
MGNIIGVVGPFIYGVSYTFNPAVDEPLLVQKFGSIRAKRTASKPRAAGWPS